MLSRTKKQDYGEHVEEGGGYQGGGGRAINKQHQSDSSSFLQVLSLDLRSLALFRVALGLLIVCDLLNRSGSMFAHYANLGVWPVVEAINNINPHSFSIHFSNGNMPFQIIILLVTLVFAVFYLVGFKTRISNVLLWLLMLSLHNRNVLLLNSGDDLLRMLLFWSIFLPIGDRFSVDSASQTAIPQSSNKYLSFTSACFIIQLMAVYWVGYLLKTGLEWEEGSAMYYLFSVDQYTTPFGYFVLRFPSFLVLLTKLYLWIEILFPILLVFPMSNGITRLTGCFASIALFSFMGLCLELGLFTYSPIVASLGLLPSMFWDKLLPNFSLYIAPDHTRYWSVGGSTTLYYSSNGLPSCILSTKILLQLANTFLGLNCPILTAEKQTNQNYNQDDDQGLAPDSASEIGRYLSDNHLLWVAVDGTGKKHPRQRGLLALMNENPFTSVLVPILYKIEKPIAFIYGFFAFLHQFSWAQATILFTSSPPATFNPPRRNAGFPKPKLTDIVAVVLLVYILWWNIGTVNTNLQLQGDAQWLGLALRIDQWWSMFTPSPIRDDGWFVIPAKLANGKEVDLFKPGGGPISYEKPTFVSRTFKDHRWRRYLMNILSGAHQDKRLFYGRYLCRQWNWYGKGSVDKDYQLKTFRIVYLKEITLPNYKVKGPEPNVLWEHQC